MLYYCPLCGVALDVVISGEDYPEVSCQMCGVGWTSFLAFLSGNFAPDWEQVQTTKANGSGKAATEFVRCT